MPRPNQTQIACQGMLCIADEKLRWVFPWNAAQTTGDDVAYKSKPLRVAEKKCRAAFKL